ncbi:hypothetical protein QOZ80_4BG0347500 [Eleusine coracana subsp. coracana]|nr:hypothetical protein QOZ80_4BG0347500 [Eleusine coracana subsp. coracana]
MAVAFAFVLYHYFTVSGRRRCARAIERPSGGAARSSRGLHNGETARFLLRCGHGFYTECVDLWLRRRGQDGRAAAAAAFGAGPPTGAAGARELPEDEPTHERPVLGITKRGRRREVVGWSTGRAGHRGPGPGDGGAGKPMGLARLSSLRRLWNRGRQQDTGASSSRSCRRAPLRCGW